MTKPISKRVLSILLALMLLVSLLSVTALADTPDGYTSISELADGEGGYRITASGNYYLDITDATVYVQLADTDTGFVAIAGDGIDSDAVRNGITIDCAAGTQLRLENLYILCGSASAIRFIGEGNVLDISGDVLLEATAYNANAVVAVNAGTTLDITGAADSRFFLYKYTAGCGIGADANNANGTINIQSGNLFFKGSKTGAIIGNDTCGDTGLEAQMGAITISGGNVEITAVAQGAAIGGSRMSKGNTVAITGGSVFILTDFKGSAIGAGAQMNSTAENNGSLTVGPGASLKLIRTGNSLYSDSTADQYLNDTLATAALANGNGGVALRQCAVPVSGSSVTITEGETTLYSGSNPTIYPYVGSTTSTVANWDFDAPETGCVYIYLTEEDHSISVNGTAYVCTWDSANDAFTVAVAPISYGEDGFTADGSAYDPDATAYTVTAAAQLKTIADGVNLGDTFEGKTVTLGSNVSLADYAAWTPIGGAATQHPLTLTSQEDLDAALEEHFLIYDSVGASYVRGSDKNGLYDPNRSYYYVTGAAFAGTFDGSGYAISDLTVNASASYAGLFGNVSGTVKDLAVSGSVTLVSSASGDFVGGICGKLSAGGLIEDCVSNVTVDASNRNAFNIGGITGFVGEMGVLVSESNPMATVRNCVNNGNVSGYNRTGGIAGRNAGTIEGCVNTGKVFNYSGAKKGTGGIAGFNGVNNNAVDAGIIVNCYNLGEVDCNDGHWTGGIAGFNNAKSTVNNSYNAGPITKNGTQVTTNVSWTNPIVGQNEGTVGDCLFLDTTKGMDASGVGNAGGTVTNVVMKTADELKAPASVTFLNGDGGDAWNADDAAAPISGGYPVLAWQGGTPVAAAATLTLEDNFEEPAEGYFTAAGITVTPSASDLSFTVTCDSACVVAIENADGTYTILEDTGSEGVHQYTAASADDTIVVAVKGDPSGDGVCDLTDVLAMVDSFMGTDEFTALQTMIADTDNSGTVDLTDVLAAVDAYMSAPFNW